MPGEQPLVEVLPSPLHRTHLGPSIEYAAGASVYEVQGYLFSRPAPAGELPMLIERLKRTDEYEPGCIVARMCG
jgi:hypothetical protein